MAMTMGGVNSSLTTLNNINSAMQKTTQKIATGSNYPVAKNGSSAYAILQRMDSHISATSQSAQNVQNAGAMIKTAEGATANTITALSTIKEYIMKAADGAVTNPDRAALQEGVNQLVSQIDENSHVTYNGKHILDGTEENSGIAGVIGYENFNLGDIRAESLGLVDSQGNVTLDISSQDAAQKSLGVVNNATSTILSICHLTAVLSTHLLTRLLRKAHTCNVSTIKRRFMPLWKKTKRRRRQLSVMLIWQKPL